jgi:hypothetical protein
VSLGWHFPSDVAGGYLLAAAFALAVLAALRAADARWPHRGQVRRAAREALATPSPAVAAAAVAVPLMLAAAIAAPYAYGAVTYAGDHTAFTVVALGMALAAVAMNAGLAAISSRRR